MVWVFITRRLVCWKCGHYGKAFERYKAIRNWAQAIIGVQVLEGTNDVSLGGAGLPGLNSFSLEWTFIKEAWLPQLP